MMEKVTLAPQRPRKTDAEIEEECKSWAIFGKTPDRPRNVITSLELRSEEMEKINLRLQAKYKAMEENEVRYEAIECDDADYVIVALGGFVAGLLVSGLTAGLIGAVLFAWGWQKARGGGSTAQAVALAYWHLPADFFLRVPQSARRHFIG